MDKQQLIGTVVDINDPLKIGRIRVKVDGYFDGLETEQIPFASPLYTTGNELENPPLNSMVNICFPFGVLTKPAWYKIAPKAHTELSESDYKTASVLLDKDLSLYDSKGRINVSFKESTGFTIRLDYADAHNTIELRSDNSILLKNGKSGRVIHLSNDSISLGSENKSKEPLVLGIQNKNALNTINDSTKSQFTKLLTELETLSTVCSTSPYTLHLVTAIKKITASLRIEVTSKHKTNGSKIETTNSEVGTID